LFKYHSIKITSFIMLALIFKKFSKIWENNQDFAASRTFLFMSFLAFQRSVIEKIIEDILVVLTCILTVRPDRTAFPNRTFYGNSHRSTPYVYYSANFPCLNWRTSKWSSNQYRWISLPRFLFSRAIHNA